MKKKQNNNTEVLQKDAEQVRDELEAVEVTTEQIEEEPSIEDLQALLLAKEEELLQVKGKLSRLAQDFESFRARNTASNLQAFTEGKEKTLIGFVGFGDDIDRAIAACADENTKKGLLLLQANFQKILEQEGITVVNPLGEVFDPEVGEAISSIPAQEGQDVGIVVQVFAKGYKKGNKMLKFAQVVVTVE